MELIQDHQPDAGQLRIVLQHAGKNAFGDHFEARARPHAGLGTHPVTYRFARLFVQQLRQTLRHVARGQPARLQQDNFPADVSVFQDLQRQPGGLTRARRGIQQNLRGMA